MTVQLNSRTRHAASWDLSAKEEGADSNDFFSTMINRVREVFFSSNPSSRGYRPNFSSGSTSLASKRIGNLQHGTWNAMGWQRVDNNYSNR